MFLKNILQKVKKKKLNFTITKRIDKDCLTISIHKKSEIKMIFDFLYKDATIFMNRKYNKFKEILEIPS